MGAEQVQFIKEVDLQRIPIYCMGFSSDIHFAANEYHFADAASTPTKSYRSSNNTNPPSSSNTALETQSYWTISARTRMQSSCCVPMESGKM